MKFYYWDKMEKKIRKCPKCNSDNLEQLYSDYDEASWWIIYKCKTCGTQFSNGGSEQ